MTMREERCGEVFCPALCDAHQLIVELLDCLARDDVPSGHISTVVHGARVYLTQLGYGKDMADAS